VRLIPREEFIKLSLNPDMATNPREMAPDDIGHAWDMLAKAG
jgi:hypothetical protein